MSVRFTKSIRFNQIARNSKAGRIDSTHGKQSSAEGRFKSRSSMKLTISLGRIMPVRFTQSIGFNQIVRHPKTGSTDKRYGRQFSTTGRFNSPGGMKLAGRPSCAEEKDIDI
jgi:hypothetical protein